MPKKSAPPETTLERLQSLNLITRLASDLNAQIGLNDKTLTEFIINLAEKTLKSAYKKLSKDVNLLPHMPISFDLNTDDKHVPMAQEFRATLASNGAELPLGFVSSLLSTVWEMSPRMKRFQKTIQDKRDAKIKRETDVVGSVALDGEKQLLGSYEHSGRKEEIGKDFPGLAVPNASHAIELDDFQELSKEEEEKVRRQRARERAHTDTNNDRNSNHNRNRNRNMPPPPLPESSPPKRPPMRRDNERNGDRNSRSGSSSEFVGETSKRKQSNLPAWMTKNQDDASSSDSKRMRSNDENRSIHTSKSKSTSKQLEMHGIYKGKINKILDFGVFVDLDIEPRQEGMIHISQLSTTKLKHPRDAGLRKMQPVYIKVISLGHNGGGGKIMLSLKDVDQSSGKDLMPHRSRARAGEGAARGDSVAASSTAVVHPGLDVAALKRREEEEDLARKSKLAGMDNTYIAPAARGRGDAGNRRRKQLTEQELFEAQQLIRSGVLGVEQYPTFDNAGGMGMLAVEETEEEADVELADFEPAFLKGQTRRSGKDLSPVRIVKNPDGSMQRAAMQQSSLAKERRELRTAQANSLMDSIPKDLNRPWEDPLPEAGERHFAQELRSINMSTFDGAPEWKQKAQSKTLSYGVISSKSIKEQRESLPVYRLKSELIQAFKDNQVLVVIGETGSGKTTQMTQYMVDMGLTKRGMIGCTQPRRVAAVSVAKRVAEEYGCSLGEQVGYSIRFEDCTSRETIIKYMTDGMLMREYLADNDLRRYSVLMLDEAHERTIHTDVLFGLLKDLCRRRPDLKIVVTSATLDAEKFSTYFFKCPIFTIPGRTFPVEILYTKEPESDYLDAALITVMQIHLSEPAGDILVFLTGQEEIDTCCETLFTRMQALGDLAPELIILPVYSALPSEMQSRIFEPAPQGARKCVVATNIAEASLTIDGIYYVVDPGFSKQKAFNAKLGMDSLVVTPISQASARQRAGRAGRTGPGKCYRLYTEIAYKQEMLSTNVPEIQRTNLGNVVLQLKAMGINDLLGFDFMDPPPVATLVGAMESLHALGALDDEGLMTRLGRKMAEFPLEPNLSKMLLLSVDLGCSDEILTITALLSVENPFFRPKDKQAQADMRKAKFHQAEGDHLTLLTVWKGWEAAKFSNPWCFENFVQARSMKRAQDVRKQLVTIMDRYKLDIISAGKNYKKICKAITAGFFTNAAKKDAQEGYRTVVDNNPVYIHPSSAIFNKNPEWVIYHELVLTTKEYMRNIMVIEAKWLTELAPAFYKSADPNKMTKAKRLQKIEPLHDRFNPKDSWRLSRRKG